MRRKLWLSKSKPGNIKQNKGAWRFFKVVLLKTSSIYISELLQTEFKFVTVVPRHFWRSRAFLAGEIFNSTLQQLIALMKWLPNTKSKKKRLGTIKGKDN